MSDRILNLPVDDAAVEELKIGDIVYLTGTVYTARDMGHLEMRKLVEAGQPLPEDLAGNAIFHAGPVCLPEGDGGWRLNVIGPTTSIRMEPHADFVGQLGVKLILGKGGMAEGTLAACKKYKQAYLQAICGCAVKIGAGVKAVKRVHWLENGMPEAMWVLDVEKFGPVVVGMDCHGDSIYDNVKAKAQKVAEELHPI